MCSLAQDYFDEGQWVCRANVGAKGHIVVVTARKSSDGVGLSGSVGEHNVIITHVPPVERGEPLSHFERMVLKRLDTIVGDQRKHYEFFAIRFQHFDD